MDNLIYTVTSAKDFEEAVKAVVNETEAVGFRVLYIHDVKDTLGKKGHVIEPLKIIEVCNAKNAYMAIRTDINLALMLPCRVNVYIKNGKVYISALRPGFMQVVFPEIDIADVVADVDKKLIAIVEQAK